MRASAWGRGTRNGHVAGEQRRRCDLECDLSSKISDFVARHAAEVHGSATGWSDSTRHWSAIAYFIPHAHVCIRSLHSEARDQGSSPAGIAS